MGELGCLVLTEALGSKVALSRATRRRVQSMHQVRTQKYTRLQYANISHPLSRLIETPQIRVYLEYSALQDAGHIFIRSGICTHGNRLVCILSRLSSLAAISANAVCEVTRVVGALE